MRPGYQLDDELSEKDRAILADTLPIRFGVVPSTLEKPLGTEFTLPIGLVKPDHFAALADYIRHGHGLRKYNFGESVLASAESVNGERIYKVMDIAIDTSKATDNGCRIEGVYKILADTLTDDAVQRVMPQALMFLKAAEEVDTFIFLCDKLEINKAKWTAIASYDLICFTILHNIPLPIIRYDDALGPLGDVLTVKKEEVREMMPKEAANVCRGVVGAAFGRHMLMKGVIDEEAKLYLKLDGSEWDSTVNQVGVAMK